MLGLTMAWVTGCKQKQRLKLAMMGVLCLLLAACGEQNIYVDPENLAQAITPAQMRQEGAGYQLANNVPTNGGEVIVVALPTKSVSNAYPPRYPADTEYVVADKQGQQRNLFDLDYDYPVAKLGYSDKMLFNLSSKCYYLMPGTYQFSGLSNPPSKVSLTIKPGQRYFLGALTYLDKENRTHSDLVRLDEPLAKFFLQMVYAHYLQPRKIGFYPYKQYENTPLYIGSFVDKYDKAAAIAKAQAGHQMIERMNTCTPLVS